MKTPENIKILFIAGFALIVQDKKASRKLYKDTLGISFEEMDNGYLYTEKLEGADA